MMLSKDIQKITSMYFYLLVGLKKNPTRFLKAKKVDGIYDRE